MRTVKIFLEKIDIFEFLHGIVNKADWTELFFFNVFFSQCAGIANTNESPGAPHTAGFLQMTVCTTDWLILEACTHTYPLYPARAPVSKLKRSGYSREYWIIYRGTGFLAVVYYDSTPRLPSSTPLQSAKLSLFLSLPVCRQSSLLTGEGEWVGEELNSEKARPSINHSILSWLQ